MRLQALVNLDTTPAARAAHLFAEALFEQLGITAEGLDLADATWTVDGVTGCGIPGYLVARGLAPASHAEAWLSNATGLAQHAEAPPAFRRLPAAVLDPTYRLPSSRGLPDSRAPRLWQELPFPADAPPPGSGHPTVRRVAPPDAVYEYRNAAGELVLRVCRWEAQSVGTTRKLILPEIWARPARSPALAPRLVPAWPHAQIPLFNRAELEARHGEWVLLVEGEKSAQAVRRRFPKLIGITIAGGLTSRTDWSPLAGRSVLILPDQDHHGLLLAQRCRQLAVAAGARVARVVNLPAGAPEGWDVADALPPGWTAQTLEEAIGASAKAPVAAPDFSLLLAARRPPEPVPEDLLPQALRPSVAALAEGLNVAPDFIALPLLALPTSLAGGLIDCEVRAGWVEHGCLLWGVAVGDPSSGKTPAAAVFAAGFEAIERELAQQHADRLVLWQAECASTGRGQPRPPRPVRELARIGNTTAPAVAPLLVNQRRGLTLFTDELSQWVENLAAGYRGKGSTDRPFWLKAFDARSDVYIRRTVRDGEPLLIPVLGVGVIGYVQPDPLARAMAPGAGPTDGLYDRILFAWPEPPVATTPDLAALGLELDLAPLVIERVMRRCFDLGRRALEAGRRVRFTLSPEAAARFDAWRCEYVESCRRERGSVSPFEGKAPGHVIRLAVACAMLEWAMGNTPEPSPEIGRTGIESMIAARTGYFAAHRERVDQDAAEPDADKLTRTLARWVVRERARVLNLADLRRHVRLPGLRSAEGVLLAVRGLQEAGWIARELILPDPRDWRREAPLEVPLAPALAAALQRIA
jgi:5S rRNA maturation endonuclease (ribonuclease M5)